MQDHDKFLINPGRNVIRFVVLGNKFADLYTTIKKARIDIAQIARLSSLGLDGEPNSSGRRWDPDSLPIQFRFDCVPNPTASI